MKKLLRFLDTRLLMIGVGFLLLFIPLYPKLPSIHIVHTWVYIRLEDFFIVFITGFWFVQFLRKKVSLPVSLAIPFGIYWFSGLISLLIGIFIIGPTLASFFPNVAILSYLRRIEYMVLFFVAFSTIRSVKDLFYYIWFLFFAVFGIIVYGFGQRAYLWFWETFPSFFKLYPFCFPSFQTGNEEFAKGLALCLPPDARITSTFGGHYDLGAYLVLIIPILVALIFGFKKWYLKIISLILSIGSLVLLILTASRVSFIAYLIAIISMFIFVKKKKFIIPAVVVSITVLLIFSGSTAKRLLETIRITSIVTNNQGQIVGEEVSSLPSELQKKISKNPVVVGSAPPTQNLPVGSSFISLPQTGVPVTTSSAVIASKIAQDDAKRLKLQYGGELISTISGSFLIQKALVYDISFTTRFQAEWPNAWKAFLKNPPFGSGFSTITLATDGDYLRFLGESGFLGLAAFFSIFLILAITLRAFTREGITDNVSFMFLFGITAGIIGILVNAVFIDVFEASKVAENLWLLLGIGAGVLFLYKKHAVNYLAYCRKILLSNIFIFFYFLILLLIVFIPGIYNFFVGSDFTWLRLAASSTLGNTKEYFLHSQGFVYAPFAKVVMFFLYTIFSFQPVGYHLFVLVLHLLMVFGVFLLARKVLKSTLFAFFAAILFLILPAHGENIFWISSFPVGIASVFTIYSLLSYISFREKQSIVSYTVSILLFMCSLFSHEGSIVLPVLLVAADVFILKDWKKKTVFLFYLPYLFLLIPYMILRNISHALIIADYSSHVLRLISNLIYNVIGYFKVFMAGQNSLQGNTVLIVFIVVLAAVMGSVILFRKKLLGIYKNDPVSSILFCFVFTILALAPFLGLENISARFGYLGSAGYVVLIACLLQLVLQLIIRREIVIQIIAGIVIVVSVFFYSNQLQTQQKDWEVAGEIAQQALSILRVNYTPMPRYSNFFFIDVPVKKGNAWVLPAGLADGMWFIYRDPTLKIYQVDTYTQARRMVLDAAEKTLVKNFVFEFNVNGVMEAR